MKLNELIDCLKNHPDYKKSIKITWKEIEQSSSVGFANIFGLGKQQAIATIDDKLFASWEGELENIPAPGESRGPRKYNNLTFYKLTESTTFCKSTMYFYKTKQYEET